MIGKGKIRITCQVCGTYYWEFSAQKPFLCRSCRRVVLTDGTIGECILCDPPHLIPLGSRCDGPKTETVIDPDDVPF